MSKLEEIDREIWAMDIGRQDARMAFRDAKMERMIELENAHKEACRKNWLRINGLA